METLHFFLGAQLLFMGYQSIKLRNLKRSMGRAQNKYISIVKKNDMRLHELYVSFEKFSKARVLPPHLKRVPLADQEGIVLSTKTVHIPGVCSAYNAALMKEIDGYLLFFRYDEPLSGDHTALYGSNIGCIRLTQEFEPQENTFSKIETGSIHSEDARVFQVGGEKYLLFNDSLSESNQTRRMRLGLFHEEVRRLHPIVSLKFGSSSVEKNWTPFLYRENIYFLYTICPQQILKLTDPVKGELEQAGSSFSKPSKLEWTRLWGIPRGGTPAQLVDGEYLSFFHSSFEDIKGIRWYVMGAYTFQAEPPFSLTRISPYPILFKNIYETEIASAVHPGTRSLYPTGFVCEEKEGKTTIYVSCGENDSVVKIIAMDKNLLLASLIKC